MPGLPWIQVATDLLDHPKAKALVHRFTDPHAAFYPIALWIYLARHAPLGFLPDNDDSVRVFEAAMLWGGEPGALVQAMTEVGFLDRKRRRISAHGWEEWQKAHIDKLERDRERMRKNREEKRRRKHAADDAASHSKEFDGAESDKPPQPPDVPPNESRDRRALDGDGDGDRDTASASAGALLRAFKARVESILGRLLPEEEPKMAATLAAEVKRLGLDGAVAVARTAIEKRAKQGDDPPETLRFFLGWLNSEGKARRRGKAGRGTNGTGSGNEPPNPLAAAIEAHRGACPEWADLLSKYHQDTPADRDAAAKWLAPIRARVADGVLHLEAPTPYAATFVRDTYATHIEAAAGLKVEVSP